MATLGVIEIFFGPPWNAQARQSYASFLKQNGYEFYLYAPKAESHLRREWHLPWPDPFLKQMADLSKLFRAHGVRFGVGLSPIGFAANDSVKNKKCLQSKIEQLSNIGIDDLGLFFDDMPVTENLAEQQLQAIEVVRGATDAKISFCPSFYSFDPILDKVFGERPENYLKDIGEQVPQSIEIMWTGPKVISPEISESHLGEVAKLLKRKPFICDNFYANDGPKNCKFLKLKLPEGRSKAAFAAASIWSFNPMNQPFLSQLVLVSMQLVAVGGMNPKDAWDFAVTKSCSKPLASFVLTQQQRFASDGLDAITEEEKITLLQELNVHDEPIANDISDWLRGKYTVGNECLTD